MRRQLAAVALLALGALYAGPGWSASEVAVMNDLFVPRLNLEKRKHGDRLLSMVQIEVPAIPGFLCEIWCYEGGFGGGEAQLQPDGSLILKQNTGDVELTSHFVPEHQAVLFNVEVKAPTPAQAMKITGINPCWQLTKAQGFGHDGDFVETFVNQCFVYTINGFTLFRDTTRFPDTRKPDDDPVNTPPWVQIYPPVWAIHGGQPEAFWGISTDRPIYSLIGCVSRDGRYLTALGWGKSHSLSQGWHDCLHIHPNLVPDYDVQAGKFTSHGKFYFMENEPNKLLARYLADFPQDWQTELLLRPTTRGNLLVNRANLALQPPRLRIGAQLSGEALLTRGNTWRRHLWGTLTREGQNATGRCKVWARPFGDFVDVCMTVANDSQTMARAEVNSDIAGAGWDSDGADGWVTGLFWEQTEAEIEPGEQQTFRGQMYLSEGTTDALQAHEEAVRAEWEHAQPFRLLLPPPGG